jgi:hypothetical protein
MRGRRTFTSFVLLAGAVVPALAASEIRSTGVGQPLQKMANLSLASIDPDTSYAGAAAENPKLSSHLVKLAEFARQTHLSGGTLKAHETEAWPQHLRSLVEARRLRMDDAGRVQVYIRPEGALADGEEAVRRAGGTVERSSESTGYVQARVSPETLEALAADGAVRFVRLPDYGYPNTGSRTSAGDRILEASVVRADFGVDGTGIKVGVISDGVGGLAQSQSTGDLPAGVNTTTCNVAGGSPGADGAEGTAMMEIVHDLAPGASLLFGHMTTSNEFNQAVDCLAANADVVVDDESWFNVGPYNGTNVISANTSAQLNKNTNRIRAYATSVGNQAVEHYLGKFKNAGFTFKFNNITYTVHQFAGGAGTTDAGDGLSCDGTGNAPFCANTVDLVHNGALSVFLQWDSPFNSASDDYDLFLLDSTTGHVVASSTDRQNGHQEPTESVFFTNKGAEREFYILVGLRSGVARNLSMFVPSCSEGTCGGFSNGTDLNFNTEAGSVPAEGDANGGVMSVGAIDAADPNNVDIEFYSSHGPTADGRSKPDITAIDGVQVTGVDGFGSPFFGTSAAAPHIAGIAALLLELGGSDFLKGGSVTPSIARGFIRSLLEAGAIGLGSANVFGAGRAAALPSVRIGLAPASVPCVPSGTALCFDDSPGDGRFRAEVVFDAGGSQVGSGNSIGLSSLGVTAGGLYWFFGPDNPEMLLKILNGCGVNNDFWVFYAAGTNVNLSTIISDTQADFTLVYSSPGGFAAQAVQDTSAFGCDPDNDGQVQVKNAVHHNVASWFASMREVPLVLAAHMPERTPVVAPDADLGGWTKSELTSPIGHIAPACENNSFTLCLDGRFVVTTQFQSSTASGSGVVIPLAGLGVTEGGLFWFFSPSNPEMLIKVVNGCGTNDEFWVFFSATTNVALNVTVFDTLTGHSRSYTNPLGQAAQPVQDTSALPCS